MCRMCHLISCFVPNLFSDIFLCTQGLTFQTRAKVIDENRLLLKIAGTKNIVIIVILWQTGQVKRVAHSKILHFVDVVQQPVPTSLGPAHAIRS